MKNHTLTMGGHRIRVRVVPKLSIAGPSEKPDHVDVGYAHLNRGIIEVLKEPWPDVTPESTLQTYLHEVVHIIDEVYCGETLTEQQVEGVSQGLLQLVQQRKKWLGK